MTALTIGNSPSNQQNQRTQHFYSLEPNKLTTSPPISPAISTVREHLKTPLTLQPQNEEPLEFNGTNFSSDTNSLLWQPWRDLRHAVSVHQHIYRQQLHLQKETNLASKELPTAKWRRERRLRAAEYYGSGLCVTSSSTASPSCSPPLVADCGLAGHSSIVDFHGQLVTSQLPLKGSVTMRTLCVLKNQRVSQSSSLLSQDDDSQHLEHFESPIDMSVSSSTIKQRVSPPPPYREPLSTSNYRGSSYVRPSVITQAPPKRDSCEDPIQNHENKNTNSETFSMCENVIDEHFRRSLGPDYVALFGNRSPGPTTTSSPKAGQSQQQQIATSCISTPPPYLPHLVSQSFVSLKSNELLNRSTSSANRNITKLLTKQQALSQTIVAPSLLDTTTDLSSQKLLPTQSHQQTISTLPRMGETDVAQNLSLVTSSTPANANANSTDNRHVKTELESDMTTTAISPTSPTPSLNNNCNILASVDDHFAKALGETWKKLQDNSDGRK